MTDTTTETPPPTERTPEQAIEWLGERADRLQQIAVNIKQALQEEKISKADIANALGYSQTTEGQANAKQYLEDAANRIYDAAFIAHQVSHDTRQLSWNERNSIEGLLPAIGTAYKALKHVTKPNITEATRQNREAISNLSRDKDDLAQYAKEITQEEIKSVVEYNRGFTERHASKRSPAEIDGYKEERYRKGVDLLKRSHEFAYAGDPSYRKHHDRMHSHSQRIADQKAATAEPSELTP